MAQLRLNIDVIELQETPAKTVRRVADIDLPFDNHTPFYKMFVKQFERVLEEENILILNRSSGPGVESLVLINRSGLAARSIPDLAIKFAIRETIVRTNSILYDGVGESTITVTMALEDDVSEFAICQGE